MKKFTNPEMKIVLFDAENVVTESVTAADAAVTAIENGTIGEIGTTTPTVSFYF